VITETSRLDGLLTQMRAAFGERRWEETIQLFGEMSKFRKLPRNVNVETTCLAARSMVNLNNRSGARKLLASIAEIEHKKAAPYTHLVQAYMDLRNYREVAKFCERIIALDEAA